MVKLKMTQSVFILICLGIIVFYLVDFFPIESAAAPQPNATEQTRENFDKSSFFWIVGIVGGCIAITLTYVSVKKYKAEEKKKIEKDSNS